MSGAKNGTHLLGDPAQLVEGLQLLLQDGGSDQKAREDDRQTFKRALIREQPLGDGHALPLLPVVLEGQGDFTGQILATLLQNAACRRDIAQKFTSEPTKVFEHLWQQASVSLRAFVLYVLLAPQVWPSEETRTTAEEYTVQLLLAKMLEPGAEDPQLALFGLANLLAADVAKLDHLIDSYALDMIFTAFSHRHCEETRSQATLIVAKLFEAGPDRVSAGLTQFVAQQIKTQKIDRLILACLLVSHLFPVMRAVMANMVLRDGFLRSLMQLVDRSGNSTFRKAAMELLSAACLDRPCREAIRKQCDTWVWDHAQSINGDDADNLAVEARALAAVVSAKIRADSRNGSTEGDELVDLLKRLAVGSKGNEKLIDEAIEALAYQSTQPAVKESIVNDKKLLETIISHLAKPDSTGMTLYGGLMLISNLTRYSPITSPEQQKMAELKAYADRSKAPVTHSLDKDGPVTERCKKLLDADVSLVLVRAANKASPTLLTIISQIILAVSKHPKHRGVMAQHLLFSTIVPLATTETDSPASTPSAKRNAALALARILVPIDPSLLFKTRPIEPVITALNHLLAAPLTSEDTRVDEQYWTGQPIVTALQALANLASLTATAHSSDPDYAVITIISACLPAIDDHFQSTTSAIRTAATELLVNLSQAPMGHALFTSTEDSKSSHRFRILTAYFGDEELKLRSAAGGALATVLGYGEPEAVEKFLATEHGIDYTVEALEDADEGLRARALVIVGAVLQVIKQQGVIEKVKQTASKVAKENFMPAMLQMQKLGIPRGCEQQCKEINKIMQSLGR